MTRVQARRRGGSLRGRAPCSAALGGPTPASASMAPAASLAQARSLRSPPRAVTDHRDVHPQKKSKQTQRHQLQMKEAEQQRQPLQPLGQQPQRLEEQSAQPQAQQHLLQEQPSLSCPSEQNPKFQRHLVGSAANSVDGAVATSTEFQVTLAERCLPESLDTCGEQLDRFTVAVRSTIEGLYRDRILPAVGEIHARLRSSGSWTSVEIHVVGVACARHCKTYLVVPPRPGGEPSCVFLRDPPTWFQGWVDPHGADEFGEEVWEELAEVLDDPYLMLEGTASQAAAALRQRGLPPGALRRLSLGELRLLVQLALGKERSLLAYDALHGGRLRPIAALRSSAGSDAGRGVARSDGSADAAIEAPRPCGTEAPMARALPLRPLSRDVALRSSSGSASAARRGAVQAAPGVGDALGPGSRSEDAALAQALRSRPLSWDALGGLEEVRRRQDLAKACVESCYYDRIEPTLAEVQRRLLASGWSFEQTQLLPVLCARRPEVFGIAAPSEGRPCRITLCEQPPWFRGWIDCSAGSDPYAPETWEALRHFLASNGHVALAGGVSGAACALKEMALAGLEGLALGELQDLVRRAIFDNAWLGFDGEELRTSEEALEAPLLEAPLAAATSFTVI